MLFKNLSIFLIAALLVGCKSENPNPELLDPIYLDIKKNREELEKLLETEVKGLPAQEKKFAETEVRSRERTVALRDLDKSKKKISIWEQELTYLKIREERRRVEARRDYKLAFSKDQPWPDPKEFESYKEMRKLRTASRSWDSRVPKLSDRIPKQGEPKKKDASKTE